MVIRKFFELLGAFVVSDYIPFLEFLDVGKYNEPMKKVSKEVDDIMERWLKEIKSERESAKQHEGKPVFMNRLISILEGASKDDYPGYDHDTIIKATSQVNSSLTFFFFVLQMLVHLELEHITYSE